jgi:hypothetical protein
VRSGHRSAAAGTDALWRAVTNAFDRAVARGISEGCARHFQKLRVLKNGRAAEAARPMFV